MDTFCPPSHVVDSTLQILPLELLHRWHELHYLSFPDAPMLSFVVMLWISVSLFQNLNMGSLGLGESRMFRCLRIDWQAISIGKSLTLLYCNKC